MIEKISVTNWMAHREFESELKSGKNLIYGCNASGKSSLAKAIAFNLTGNLPKKKIDPRREKKQLCVVDLTIQGSDNKRYLIRRQINKGSKINHTLFIYDVNDLSEALYTAEDAEKFLQNLLGMNQDIFERIIYMKEEDVHEFLAKPDGGVLFEIDRLIGLDKAHKISNDMTTLLGDLKSNFNIVKKDRQQIETAVKRELGIKESKTDINKTRKRLAEIITETDELLKLQGYYETRNELVEKISQIKGMADEQDENKLETKLIEKQVKTQKEQSTVKDEIESEKKKFDDLILTRSTLEAKKDLKDKIIDDLSKDREIGEISECPTCGREMDKKLTESTIKKLKSDLSGIAKNLQKQIDEMESINNSIKKKVGMVTELEKRIVLLKDLKEITGQTLIEFNTNESAIKSLKKKNYPETIKEIEKKLDTLGAEGSELDRSIGRAEGAQEVTSKMVEKRLKQEKELEHKMKIIELIGEATEKTTKKMRETYTAQVKNLAESIWKQYKDESWRIEWDKDFVPKARIISTERELIAYEMSGSEKFLILLAIRLAIQQSLDHFQLLIIDEPCQHLDETNGRLFRDILTSIDEKKIGQSIVFTYNQDFLDGKWSNVLKLSE
ncbi:MAG: AAA family ATPase [Asgard group archaeon]|nr:AAA family ATPase [Asgard group archaeon]